MFVFLASMSPTRSKWSLSVPRQNTFFMNESMIKLKIHCFPSKRREKWSSGIFCFAISLKKKKFPKKKKIMHSRKGNQTCSSCLNIVNMAGTDEAEIQGLGLKISYGEKQCVLPQRSFCQTEGQHDGIILQSWLIMWPKIILFQRYQEAHPGNCSFDRIL